MPTVPVMTPVFASTAVVAVVAAVRVLSGMVARPTHDGTGTGAARVRLRLYRSFVVVSVLVTHA